MQYLDEIEDYLLQNLSMGIENAVRIIEYRTGAKYISNWGDHLVFFDREKNKTRLFSPYDIYVFVKEII